MVSAADNVFAPIRRWADGKAATTLLASLLVLALVLCHGAMGSFHQLAPQLAASAALTPAHAQADHASALPEAGPDQEHPAEHGEGHPAPYLPPPGFHLAALLVVLLASVLGSAVRGAPLLPAARSWAARRPPPAAFLPARPPAASSLQVFRL